MLVIGNGESRSHINLDLINQPKVGCNAIIRDYIVDYLVCVDRRMVQESLERGANNYCLIYTRKDWYYNFNKTHKRLRIVPDLPYAGSDRWDEPFNWGSGPYAVLLGAKLSKEKEVKLLGFDLYSNTKNINNIYKSTNNYDAADKKPVDPRYWIHQIGMVFECFPKINFTIYQEENWQLPKQWKKFNVSVDKISKLV